MIKFTKMQGTGNDFVMVDAFREKELPADLPELARWACDRRFGIGGDGLILADPGSEAPFRMRMFNPDGSASEMCGNGIRCLARLLRDHGHTEADSVPVETGAGILTVELRPGGVRVDMGRAKLSRQEIGMPGIGPFVEEDLGNGLRGTAVSMGNPHLVIFVDDVAAVDLVKLGRELEHHPLFPNRTNVHFVQVVDRQTLIQRTWERGAGITLACGTGACACAVAAVMTNRADRSVEIRLPGGNLHIDFDADGRVFMTGPAETVFEGEIG
ncbi:diaminopimelate epimerase [Fimbriimonas ginsengisoli]|uniref:Diaminopimelate epimerase n=1 Tax=Fimbriimonas ginsengisoli Gsoil 348 TaxID=661478 RepID=A0A068NWV5_FIMGI|nr:diaminopimelate epimerase [Fimbriimonas ginsengisoli]AIE87926.1 diaminopimelate epimerase [Fimbriimonas ginsengisoli Gsoil 348]